MRLRSTCNKPLKVATLFIYSRMEVLDSDSLCDDSASLSEKTSKAFLSRRKDGAGSEVSSVDSEVLTWRL